VSRADHEGGLEFHGLTLSTTTHHEGHQGHEGHPPLCRHPADGRTLPAVTLQPSPRFLTTKDTKDTKGTRFLAGIRLTAGRFTPPRCTLITDYHEGHEGHLASVDIRLAAGRLTLSRCTLFTVLHHEGHKRTWSVVRAPGSV
jgi:hypothetical protein